ncbi:hypothetical protein MJH12_07530, partial [bacterium]|nr:hypothetical protein [bacterium]
LHPWFTPNWCYRAREKCKSYMVTGSKLSLYNIDAERSWLIYYNDRLTAIYAKFNATNQSNHKITSTLRNKYLQDKYYAIGDFHEVYIKSVKIDLKFNNYSNILRIEDSRSIKKIKRDELKTSRSWRNSLDQDLHFKNMKP